jgi:hypothetical protein
MEIFGIFTEVIIPPETLYKNKRINRKSMLSDKMMFHFRKNATPLFALLTVALFSPSIMHAAEERSYAQEIRQYVAEDKVYLLENIRQKVTRPSEKTVLDALFSEDGPQAMYLYRKQLRDYPDPALDQLSTSRIASYNQALNSTAPLPKLSEPVPSPKPRFASLEDEIIKPSSSPRPAAPVSSSVPVKQKTNTPVSAASAVQFGSFGKRQNAEALAKKISVYEPVIIIPHNGMHKVRLKNTFTSEREAIAAAKKLPFISVVVPAI